MPIGKLYGIGVGPGDPELLTVKAARLIDETDIIFAPQSKSGKPSVALNIVQDYVDKRDIPCEIYQPLFHMEYLVYQHNHGMKQQMYYMKN